MEKKVYKYALTLVDVASRYKAVEPLTSKESDEVSKAFQRIYKRGPLKWSQLLQVDPGRELWVLLLKLWRITKLLFAVAALRYTEIKRLWKDLTEPWLNDFLGINMQLR